MGTPWGPKYIPYTYMDPFGEGLRISSCSKRTDAYSLCSLARGTGEGQKLQEAESESAESILPKAWRLLQGLHPLSFA